MTNATAIITRYIDLVGAHDLPPLDELFAEDLIATTNGDTFAKAEWIVALKRLMPVIVRNDIREIFANENRAAVFYDFVTDTGAGAVPCAEWITVRDDRITTIELIFEKANWAAVAAAVSARAAV